MNEVSGRLRITPGGFGICVLDQPIPWGGTAGGVLDDAFVPPPLLDPCLDADDLAVEIDIDHETGRATVESLRVTGRRRRLVPGRLRWRDGRASVLPNRLVARRSLRLPDAVAVQLDGLDDGAVVVVALAAFDPGRQRIDVDHVVAATPDGSSTAATRLQTVATELASEWPDDPADAVLVERLVDAALLDEPIEGAVADAGAAAVATTLHLPAAPSSERAATGGRPVTIDGPHTVDFDDAVDAEVDGDGWRVRVHIADPGSTLGDEQWRLALVGSQSVYLPSGRLDLLPTDIAAHSASLVAGEERPCLTISFRVASDGRTTDVELTPGRVTVGARLTYAQVEAHLDGTRLEDPEAAATLDAVIAAAGHIGVERERRGLFPELFPEPEFEPVPDGEGGVRLRRTELTARAGLVVERLMVAANEASGRWLHEQGWPGLYRSHPSPSTEALARLDAFVVAHRLTERFDTGPLVGDATLHLPVLAHLATELATHDPDVHLGFLSVLAAATRPATYTVRPSEHFGLGAEAYLQATSPIRRVADLVNHRLVLAALEGVAAPDTGGELERWLERVGGWAERRDRAISLAQRRERNRMLSLVLGRGIDAGTPLKATATVVGLGARALTVHLLRLGLRARLPASELGGETWEIDGHRTHVVTDAGPVWMGSTHRVAVTRCFPDTGDAEVSLLG